MNMTENLDDAGPVELDRAHLVFGVTAQIEGAGSREREHVMKKWVIVREVNRVSRLNCQDSWDERFVYLPNGRHFVRRPSKRRCICIDLFEIENDILKFVDWRCGFGRDRRPAPARVKIDSLASGL